MGRLVKVEEQNPLGDYSLDNTLVMESRLIVTVILVVFFVLINCTIEW